MKMSKEKKQLNRAFNVVYDKVFIVAVQEKLESLGIKYKHLRNPDYYMTDEGDSYREVIKNGCDSSAATVLRLIDPSEKEKVLLSDVKISNIMKWVGISVTSVSYKLHVKVDGKDTIISTTAIKNTAK